MPKVTSSMFGFGGLRHRPEKKMVAPVFDRTMQKKVTQQLTNSPKYIHDETRRGLLKAEKQIVKHAKEYSKDEVTFARDALNADHIIKDPKEALRFTRGELQTLVKMEDRGVHDVYKATHHATEVARSANSAAKASLTVKAEPTAAERLEQAGLGHNPIPTPNQPTPPAPTPGQSWKNTPATSVPKNLSSQAPHAADMHHLSSLGSISAGALRYGIQSQRHPEGSTPETFVPAPTAEPEQPAEPTPAPETPAVPTAPTPEIPSADSAQDLAID